MSWLQKRFQDVSINPVANEGILPNKFAELNNFYKTRLMPPLMPEHWRKPFEIDETLDSKAKLGAAHF